MNLEEFYAQIGGDYADTLQRLCNENMVKKFVKMYQDDPTCADLRRPAQRGPAAGLGGCLPRCAYPQGRSAEPRL